MQLVHYFQQVVNVLCENAFRKLKFNVLIRNVILIHYLTKPPDIVVVVKVQARLIYRYDNRRFPVVKPAANRLADLLENVEVKLHDKSVSFAQRDKIARHNKAKLLAVPSDKRLCALNMPALKAELRLKIALELAFLESLRHSAFVVLLAKRPVANPAVVKGNVISARALNRLFRKHRPIHRSDKVDAVVAVHILP